MTRRYRPERVAWTRERPGDYLGKGEDGSCWIARQWAVQDWHVARDGEWEDLRFWSLEEAQRHADDEVRQTLDPEYAARVATRRDAHAWLRAPRAYDAFPPKASGEPA